MKRIRLRFSLKAALLAMTIAAFAAWVAMLPSVRARRFAKLIESGQAQVAEAMLSGSIQTHALHRQTLRRSSVAMVQPLTLPELLRGERRVFVGGLKMGDRAVPGIVMTEGMENAEFVVTRGTVYAGWHSLHLW
jgi:hypothetical protein